MCSISKNTAPDKLNNNGWTSRLGRCPSYFAQDYFMTISANNKELQGDCFKLLAACFYEPDRDLFLQENLCENLVALLSANGCNAAAEAARRMQIALSEQDEEDLKVEYARLFVGPFELIAPPYGSVYLEHKRKLMGDSTMAVQKMYKSAGLMLNEKEAPDHIAFELEFMHYLCLAEVEAESQGQENRVSEIFRNKLEFMDTYLEPWISPFCEDIRQGSENSFYSNLADCLEAFSTEMKTYYEKVGQVRQNRNNHDYRASA